MTDDSKQITGTEPVKPPIETVVETDIALDTLEKALAEIKNLKRQLENVQDLANRPAEKERPRFFSGTEQSPPERFDGVGSWSGSRQAVLLRSELLTLPRDLSYDSLRLWLEEHGVVRPETQNHYLLLRDRFFRLRGPK